MPPRVPVPTGPAHKDATSGGERRNHLGLIPVPSKLLMHRNTWFLRMDTLLSATSLPRCYVILVLGTPTYKDLSPMLLSGHYAHSLVVVATHEPPDIPNLVIPALRILHLSKPLSTENADTGRLVSVLTWAERVACDWRKYGGSGIYELSEEDDDDDALPAGKRGGPRVLRIGRHSARRHSMPVGMPASPATADGKRPFDVLINFLPSQLPDHVLLRHTIFITIIGRPFFKLASATSSFGRGVFAKAKSIFGGSAHTVREKRSSGDMPRTHVEALFTPSSSTMRPLASSAAPQIIHLLPQLSAQYPQASAKIVDSMEAFIAAFKCATSLETGAKKDPDAADDVQSYIMHSATFGKALDCALAQLTPKEEGRKKDDIWGCEWTVADVLISGALDNAPTLTRGATSPAGNAAAWISGPEDISLLPTGNVSAPGRAAPLVQDLETRPLLYKTPTAPAAPIQVSAETTARANQAVVQTVARRPTSPASTYSTSYGHEVTNISPPPSFHEYQEIAYLPGPGDITSSGAVDESHYENRPTDEPPPVIEEIPKSADIPPVVTEELQNLAEIVLPRRVSIKRVQSLVAGLRDMGTWRSRRASVDVA